MPGPSDQTFLDRLITAFEGLVARVLARVGRKTGEILGADPGHATDHGLETVQTLWVDDLDVLLLPALEKAWNKSAGRTAKKIAAARQAVADEVAALTAPDAAAYLRAARNRLVAVADHLWHDTREQLAQGVEAGDDVAALTARVKAAAGVTEPRARVIARTEVVAAHNGASLAQARMLDDPTMTKQWLATPDARTRPSHKTADGQTVPIGDRFDVGDASLDFPGDPTGPPEEVVSCRCSIALDFPDAPTVAGASAYDEAHHVVRDNGGQFARTAGMPAVTDAGDLLQVGPGGGGLPAWAHTVLDTSGGPVTVGAAGDGRVTVVFGDGDSQAHTWLSEDKADKFAKRLYDASDHPDDGGLRDGAQFSVADYPPGDDRALPVGFAAVHRDGRDTFRVQLMHGGGELALNADDTRAVAKEMYRFSSAAKIDTPAGVFTSIPAPGAKVTTVWPATAGKPISLDMSRRNAEDLADLLYNMIGATDEFPVDDAGNPTLGPDDPITSKDLKVGNTVLTVTSFGQYGKGGYLTVESSGHDWSLKLPADTAYEIGETGLRRASDDSPLLAAASAYDEAHHVKRDHGKFAHEQGSSGVVSAFPGMHAATDADREDFRAGGGQAIPPGWTDVHIADDLSTAALLVRGKDSKGRGQSIYSAAHTEGQAAVKFARVKELAKHIDKLDSSVERDAGDNDAAAALLLIRRLGMRPGSNRNTGAKEQAHGATNLRTSHVTVDGDDTTFDFIGKKGVHIQLTAHDPLIASVVKDRLDRLGPDVPLFNTDEDKTREYMKSTGVPADFLLKDLRTLHANVVALRAVAAHGRDTPQTKTEFRAWRKQVAEQVSSELGNTPALALSAYISPTVFTPWITSEDWV